MSQETSDITVSICATAFNQEALIGQAIDSFLMQNTNFKFEILIGEDCSTDGTRDVINAYCQKYPDLVYMITDNQNVGLIRNCNRLFERARGKYIAICDGDDFWSDPDKLQKQVDFLEKNSEYIICCHYSKLIDENGNVIYVDEKPVELEYSYNDILMGNKKETRTSTMLIRNNNEFRQLTTQQWFLGCYAQDRFFKLFATAVSGKKIYVIPETMSYYRVHSGGTWSLVNPKKVRYRMRSDFNVVVQNFKYSSRQKRELLKIYLRDYFFDDLRYLHLNYALTTMKALV